MLVVALFLLVGVSLALLGGGGSILTVPLLVYVAGFDAKAAVALSLLIVGITSAVGLAPYVYRGHVELRVVAIFGPVSMLGAFAGGMLARYLSNTLLLVLFAVMMVATAAAMLRRGKAVPQQRAPSSASTRGLLLALEGAGVGVFTGLVGAGGGFMVVPALVLFARLEMRRAVGTSLVIISLKSFAGLLGHLNHTPIDWGVGLTLAGAAAAGALLGGVFSSKIPAAVLRRAFGVFVLLMGGLVLLAQTPPSLLESVWASRGLVLPVVAAGLAVTWAGWSLVKLRRFWHERGLLDRPQLSVRPPADAGGAAK